MTKVFRVSLNGKGPAAAIVLPDGSSVRRDLWEFAALIESAEQRGNKAVCESIRQTLDYPGLQDYQCEGIKLFVLDACLSRCTNE
jgi:hypothetical protein